MISQQRLLSLLEHVLNLNGRAMAFERDTPLFGAIPELDSMAVVSLVTELETQFGLTVEDEEIDGSTFATLGSLLDFVEQKTAS